MIAYQFIDYDFQLVRRRVVGSKLREGDSHTQEANCLEDQSSSETLDTGLYTKLLMRCRARTFSPVLKIGLTIGHLPGTKEIQPAHIAEAIQYRSLDRRI